MSHIAFRKRGEDVDAEFDFVVVGSGAGGASAAVQLARGGARVCLIEAGPWRDPHDYPETAFGGMRDMMENCGALVTLGRTFWPVVQARAVGGTTTINSAICVRTPGDLFRQWENEHGISGLEEKVLAKQDLIERELCVEEVSSPAMGRSNELAYAGEKKLNWAAPHVMRRYAKGCSGTGMCIQGCRALKKQSLNLNYIPEVMERGGTVISCAPVDKILFEGRRAIGVTGSFEYPYTKQRGARFTVRAKRAVVVAASVTRTPVLLLNSGVKLPKVGHFFRSHPGTGIFGVYDEPVDMNVGTTQGWASTAFRDKPGFKLEMLSIPPELVASRLAGGGTTLMKRLEEYRHFAMWVVAVRAESTGRVRKTLFGNPQVSYTLNEADMRRMREGLKLIALQHFAAGAKKVIPCIAGMPYELTADQVQLLDDAPLDPRRYVSVLSHLFGGAVMGRDEKTSVTDGLGRVHGYERLIVADASVIPTNLGINPQHTIMSMAQVFAEALL